MLACELDHIVIGAASLAQGVAFVRDRLAVDMPPGGKHPLMGTHNHLMRLGEGAFLEVISIDPEAPPPGRPRWFDLDDPALQVTLTKEPRIIAWVVRNTEIDAAAGSASYAIGEVIPVTRGALSWRLTVPADGRRPDGGVLPHMIAWDNGMRPWESMAERGCRLDALVLTHPRPEAVRAGLRSIGAADIPGIRVEEGPAPSLSARVVTPSCRIATI